MYEGEQKLVSQNMGRFIGGVNELGEGTKQGVSSLSFISSDEYAERYRKKQGYVSQTTDESGKSVGLTSDELVGYTKEAQRDIGIRRREEIASSLKGVGLSGDDINRVINAYKQGSRDFEPVTEEQQKLQEQAAIKVLEEIKKNDPNSRVGSPSAFIKAAEAAALNQTLNVNGRNVKFGVFLKAELKMLGNEPAHKTSESHTSG